MIDILRKIAMRLAAGGAFDVKNFHASPVDGGDIKASVGFEHHFMGSIQKPLDEPGRFRLEKRLSSRYLHQGRFEFFYFFDDVGNG